MYQVLARKWRPRNFDELVGQKHVATTLANAIESKRLAHAYIFAGLRGTGKTTVARILASCLNVENGPTVNPDLESDVVKEIAESRSMDVMELDAASRTGVDNIRELQEVISYAPVRDRYKILIIDEAHMLSKQAFNALLKTLEEPPPNVMFILATTELQKILPTILSRCQVFEFRRVRADELAQHLRRIVDAEGIKISDASLDRIARAGEGSVRDSLSVLERVLAFCGQEADDDDVMRVLGAVRLEVLKDMTRGLAAHDSGAMLDVLDAIVDEGHDLLHFWGEWISVLRDLLYMRAAPDKLERLARAPEEAKPLAEAGAALSVEDLTRAFEMLAALEPGLKSSSQPRYLFEACVIRLASLGSIQPIEEILSALKAGGWAAPGGPLPPPQKKNATSETSSSLNSAAREASETLSPSKGPAPTASRPDPDGPPPIGELRPASGTLSPSAREASGTPPTASASAPEASPSPPFHGDILKELNRRIARESPFLGTILEQAESGSLSDTTLELVFGEGNRTIALQLDRDEYQKRIQSSTEAIVGSPRNIKVRVNGAVAGAPSPTGGTIRAAGPGMGRNALMKSAREDPGVKRLLREFGAQVLEVQPCRAEVLAAAPEPEEIE